MNRLSEIARGIAAILMLAYMGMIVLTFMPNQTSNSVASAMTATDNTQANNPAKKATAYPAPAKPFPQPTSYPSPPPPPAYPSPSSTSVPAATPTFEPPIVTDPVPGREIVTELNYRTKYELPSVKVIHDTHVATKKVRIEPMSFTFKGLLPNRKPLDKPSARRGGESNYWQVIFEEDFEKEKGFASQEQPYSQAIIEEDFEEGFANQGQPCSVHDQSQDDYQRYWGNDDARAFNKSNKAAWPAKGGKHGVDPAKNDHPPNLDSWLICGPFDLSQAEELLVEFGFWTEFGNDNDDFLFFGVSRDGHSFQGNRLFVQKEWILRSEFVRGIAGDNSVWLAWAFKSDSDKRRTEGTWIDSIRVSRYHRITQNRGGFDCTALGEREEKGLALPPYDPRLGEPIPMSEREDARGELLRLNTDWVRLEVIKLGNVAEMIADYRAMAETLCAHEIRVLGLIDHKTLDRQDYNTVPLEYRVEFADRARSLSSELAEWVTYWEIWNEPDYVLGADILPEVYAHLMVDTYEDIKDGNPDAQVLFGGLASAWDLSHIYFETVYDEWDSKHGGARPFDYFAIHPYPDVHQFDSVDPREYLYVNGNPKNGTIIDKFMETLDEPNIKEKHVWITEIGWNNALDGDEDGQPSCQVEILVDGAQQARYLTNSFDTLFQDVYLWNSSTLAVDKAIWYQFMDIGINKDEVCPEGEVQGVTTWKGRVPAQLRMTTDGAVNWWFGLYRLTPEQELVPKISSRAFRCYNDTCYYNYIPILNQNTPKR